MIRRTSATTLVIVAALQTLAALVALASPAFGQNATEREDSILVRAMRAELERSKDIDLAGMATPYYVGYRVTEAEEIEVLAEFGGVVTKSYTRNRWASVEMRVGDRDFDNTNFDSISSGGYPIQLSLDDDHDVLRRQLWLATDVAYKDAVDAIENKRAALTNQQTTEVTPDFSTEKVTKTVVEVPTPASIDFTPYVALAKKMSAVLADFPIHEGGVQVRAFTVHRYFLDSDGTFGYEPDTLVSVWVAARAQADDGMNLMNYDSLVVSSAADLPPDAELEAMARKVATELIELTTAPIMKDYVGPVLFEGDAAAQVVQHMLASNMAGTPPPKDPQFASLPPEALQQMGLSAFSSKLDKRILPVEFSVVDDPSATAFGATNLVGNYTVDDEGVPAQRVELVKKGKLINFLMSRTPSKKFQSSNGHARGGLTGVRARVGNLIVTASGGLTTKQIRAQLIKAAKKAGEDYGVIIRRLDDGGITLNYRGQSGGMPAMSGGGPPAPLIAYKVMPDGSEQLVRGVLFESFPVKSLRGIVATGRDAIVYNSADGGGFGGGSAAFTVPSSIVTPTLLFGDLDLIGSQGPQTKPPILTRP